MRVYYLDDIPTPYRLGVFKLISRKLGDSFKVGFCSEVEPGRTWDLDYSGINYEILKGFQFRPPFQRNPFSFKVNFRVIHAISSHKAEMVVFSGYTHPTVFFAALYCLLKKIPFGVSSETNQHCSATNGARFWLKRHLVSPIIRYMSFGLPTGSQAEHYFKLMGADSKLPYFYFPNTPDLGPIKKIYTTVLDAEKKSQLKKKFKLNNSGLTILFVGRLIDAKNPMELLLAFDGLENKYKKENTVVIVGAGELEPKIKKFIKTRPYIQLRPWLNKPSEVYTLMALSDVFVLPSIHEPWGAVVNEAMAAGCCTVVTDKVGASYELIKNEKSGFIYESGQEKQLRKILKTLIDSSDLRLKISKNGRFSVDRFDQEFAANNFEKSTLYVKKDANK